jgi:hypothetical protein
MPLLYHKFHVDYPEMESGTPLWEATNSSLKLGLRTEGIVALYVRLKVDCVYKVHLVFSAFSVEVERTFEKPQ